MVIYYLYHLYSIGYALFAIKIINDILDDIWYLFRNFMSSIAISHQHIGTLAIYLNQLF